MVLILYCLQLRNFSAVLIHANNMFSRDVSVFKSAKIYFSVGGVYFTSRPLVYAHRPDGSSESARQVIIPVVPGRVGRAVRVSLQFDLRWIMISEIRFASGEYISLNFFLNLKAGDVAVVNDWRLTTFTDVLFMVMTFSYSILCNVFTVRLPPRISGTHCQKTSFQHQLCGRSSTD